MAKLVQICEELDSNNCGYVNTAMLAKILRGIPGVRKELKVDDELRTKPKEFVKMGMQHKGNVNQLFIEEDTRSTALEWI